MQASLKALGAGRDLASFLAHVRMSRGKMLRPGLVLLAGQCFGPLTDQHLQVAAMVEMIHHATLLHDDVLDDGQTRRGVPTANSRWGNECAVLLGDFLLSQVFRMAAELDPPVARVLAQTAVRVCQGELRQTVLKGNWGLSEAQYLEVITEKSASFFGGCCRLGAMVARADAEQIEALARFGLLAGIAFQIADDLLDLAGQEQCTGKTVQNDLAQDKPTLAVIHLLARVEAKRHAEVRALLETPASARHGLGDLLARYGSLQYARDRAADYVTQALQALEPVPPNAAKEALREAARFMVHRSA